MADFESKIQRLIDLETTTNGGVKNNKVANFAYTQTAYENNEAQGVSDFDSSRNQNVPLATPTAMSTNKTVLDRGYRSQGASIGRMLANHFWGRTSYNLNKIHDWFTDLLGILKEVISKGFWNLSLDTQTPEKDFSKMTEAGTYKGNSFDGMSNYPEYMDLNGGISEYGYWDCIVEKGNGFIKQFLFYVRQGGAEELQGHYLAIRGALTESEPFSWTDWTSICVDSNHALQSDNLGTLKGDTWEQQVTDIKVNAAKLSDSAIMLEDNAVIEAVGPGGTAVMNRTTAEQISSDEIKTRLTFDNIDTLTINLD